ncbi:hydrolase 2, exosortase A system-associated [Pseudoduganella umbonata]|uniref:Exosortase A-associated hydrolase 2 n=1 Tax=Pseudoduganella umbonata TaxID=864828 RepID=A0A4P8HSC0_9BURK|nr:hydrolase 2, exosortase A system-associated [Pseudoduganella umbonata]MBB3223837.1 exosortase A-associated hydrolase 2 [Pseudoduganella umbonata]QCP12749.1 hydrolase 2, exosortase A system-associated [Pseudoduganella umbonata]
MSAIAAAPPAQPLFLDAGAAARFCLYHAPAGPCRGAWLYLHPFAEEMNKSRRMAALQARVLAQNGYAVLQMDLYGCGDSAGDFGDARWDIWLQDAVRGLAWLEQRSGCAAGLWGLRLGALLALDMAQARPLPGLLLWQPVTNGSQFLTNFLRLKVASQMLTDGGGGKDGGGTTALKQALQAGQSLEIAGYTLDPALALAIDARNAEKFTPPACPVHWFEVAAESGRSLSPAATRVIAALGAGGANIAPHVVAGPQFWVTQEIATCPALLDATLHSLSEPCHAA